MNDQLGKKLTMLRKQAMFTQAEVAKALGVSRQQIVKYEKGLNAVPISKLTSLCNFYRVKADDFLTNLGSADRFAVLTPQEETLIGNFQKLSNYQKRSLVSYSAWLASTRGPVSI